MTRHPSPQALRGAAPEDSTGSSSRALTPTEDDGGFRGQIEQAAPNGRNSDNGLGAACRSARGTKARLDLVRVRPGAVRVWQDEVVSSPGATRRSAWRVPSVPRVYTRPPAGHRGAVRLVLRAEALAQHGLFTPARETERGAA